MWELQMNTWWGETMLRVSYRAQSWRKDTDFGCERHKQAAVLSVFVYRILWRQNPSLEFPPKHVHLSGNPLQHTLPVLSRVSVLELSSDDLYWCWNESPHSITWLIPWLACALFSFRRIPLWSVSSIEKVTAWCRSPLWYLRVWKNEAWAQASP